METFDRFLSAFLPLFVAIDAIGMVGIYISLTSDFTESVKKRLVTEATLTALFVSVIFLFFGKMIFRLLGISPDDFRVAGGIILLILAISDILFSNHEKRRSTDTAVGIVPIGIPLIMGPAALTTILISTETLGFPLTLISLLLNLAIAWFVFRNANWFVRMIGEAGTKALAKVMALFLAAIAVMMIRVGITGFLEKI
ncbi:MAG: MarC family protein [Bdellovibrionota bacterium]